MYQGNILAFYPTERQKRGVEYYLKCFRYAYNSTLHFCLIADHAVSVRNITEYATKRLIQKAPLKLKGYSINFITKSAYLAFDNNNLKRVGSRMRYKSKMDYCQSFLLLDNDKTYFDEENKIIFHPMLGKMKVRGRFPEFEKIICMKVKKIGSRYFISYRYRREEKVPKTTGEVGLDLGIQNLLTTSDGKQYHFPKTIYHQMASIKL